MAPTIQICRLNGIFIVWLGTIITSIFLLGCVDGGRNGTILPNDKPTIQIPPSPLGHYLSARLAQDELDSGRAARFYEVALSANPENQALLRQTMMLMLAEGRFSEAIDLAQRRILKSSDAPMARLILAAREIRKNDFTAARKHLSKTKRQKYMSLFKPLLLAWISGAENRYDDALETLAHLQENIVLAPFGNFHSALISEFSGHDDAARQAFQETFKNNTRRTTQLVLNYGSFLLRKGQRDDAIKLFNRMLGRNPQNPVIIAAFDRLKSGASPWPRIMTAVDGVAESFLSAGHAFSGSHGIETARIYSQLALYLRPDFDAAKMLLAETFETQKRYEDAISVYRNVRKSSSFFWSAQIRVATNMNSLGLISEAVALLESMAIEKPSDTAALIILARILRAKERFKETISAYNQIFERIYVQDKELKNHHWILLYERGIAYERSKQWSAAEKDFLHALELRPDQPRVLNYLGYSWVEQGVNLERARQMIEKAVSKRPEDGFVVDSLGWVFYRLGRYEEAVKHLERAVELRPHDPIINDHLGDAYWRAGRKLEAQFQWRHAIDLGNDEKMSTEIRAKQANGLGPEKTLPHQHEGKNKSGG